MWAQHVVANLALRQAALRGGGEADGAPGRRLQPHLELVDDVDSVLVKVHALTVVKRRRMKPEANVESKLIHILVSSAQIRALSTWDL